MKKENRTSFLIILAVLMCSVLGGCSRITDNTDTDAPTAVGDQPHAEDYEQGYDLPVDSTQQEEAEEDLTEMMELIRAIYEDTEKGTSVNVVITQDTAVNMQKSIGEEGVPAAVSGSDVNMLNYEVMDHFLKEASEGQEAETVLYRIHTDGTVSREKFTFDGQDMYSLYTKGRWTDTMEPECGTSSYSRINEWKYTEKGWFSYEYCTAQPPELTEVIDAYEMVRIRPLEEEYREMQTKYLKPIGYQGNNMLCLEWSEENMEGLDYNGLYEYFYKLEYGKEIDADKCSEGIPQDDFESLMAVYLPVTAEQLREYASYDAENKRYNWVRLGVGNYAPNAFWTSVPEVTGITGNEDGTITLTVDVVCEKKGNDDFYTHEVTMRIQDDGKAMYLSNHILEDRPGMIPDYQYRCGE